VNPWRSSSRLSCESLYAPLRSRLSQYGRGSVSRVGSTFISVRELALHSIRFQFASAIRC
jgi:hypothetical protein